jgi:hypothetical protein
MPSYNEASRKVSPPPLKDLVSTNTARGKKWGTRFFKICQDPAFTNH